jgi:ferredoxin--NADP+ reductase
MTQKPFKLSLKVILVNSQGECLLLQRSAVSKNNPGKWELPGGKLEQGEDLQHGLKREVLEETGLEIELDCVAGAVQAELDDQVIASMIFQGHPLSQTLTLSSEHQAAVWVPVEKLSESDLLPQFLQFARTYKILKPPKGDEKFTFPKYMVAIIGAGPAGLFAARELATNGVHVVLFNRDIKPGGLAEYGIYPDKHRLKEGLRAQFRQILALENVTYFGNIQIRHDGDLRLDELKSMGFQAILITAGAQGTKWLGLPGEDLLGVYHAKDLVYHYNKLPPYSQHMFNIGKKVAVVGVGNVMMDVTHYLVGELQVDEVIALARRGPAEIKFEKKELEAVIQALDVKSLKEEIERLAPVTEPVSGSSDRLKSMILETLAKTAPAGVSHSHFMIHFLSSPVRVLGNASGRVTGLEVEGNTLVRDGDEIKARGTGVRHIIEADTVIFAIGDRVDNRIGLPVRNNEFIRNPHPRFPVDNTSYEAFDPAANAPLEGVFMAGWSRQASSGLVGLARKDGVNGAKATLQYLQTLQPLSQIPLQQIILRMDQLRKPAIHKEDLLRLEAAEAQQAQKLGLEEFKFASNQEMLEAMGLVAYFKPVRSFPAPENLVDE